MNSRFHCPHCGGDLVSGEDQFADAWICPKCNREVSLKPNDPFSKAKQIRAGELDEAMPSYEELTGWLQRVPKTWLPGLLIDTARMCIVMSVFKDGGIEKVVAKVIRQQKEKHELRN